jgi:hypothetical protein
MAVFMEDIPNLIKTEELRVQGEAVDHICHRPLFAESSTALLSESLGVSIKFVLRGE